MANQKMISVKLDLDVLQKADDEVGLGYYKRNRLINEGVTLFCDLLDTSRRAKCSSDSETKKQLLRDCLRRNGLLQVFFDILR